MSATDVNGRQQNYARDESAVFRRPFYKICGPITMALGIHNLCRSIQYAYEVTNQFERERRRSGSNAKMIAYL